MTCIELRSREAALQQAVQTTQDDIAAATAEVHDDPAVCVVYRPSAERILREE